MIDPHGLCGQALPVGGQVVHHPDGSAVDALRTVATFRLVMPRTILRFAGGREITLGDLAERGVRGGVNAVIVGNYLTTLGRPAGQDIAMLAQLKMPIKALVRDL